MWEHSGMPTADQRLCLFVSSAALLDSPPNDLWKNRPPCRGPWSHIQTTIIITALVWICTMTKT